MTIISDRTDHRNAGWKANNIGSKMLSKMGWSEGEGLGRRNQGTSVHLRAVRRLDDSLGIGATTDHTGTDGWSQTTDGFLSVLKGLQKEHAVPTAADDDDDDDDATTEKKKRAKKRNKMKKRTTLVLAKNKVTAGHARKMRDAKDLSTKSDHDMAAIFGGTAFAFDSIHEHDKKKKKKKTKKKRKRSSTEDDDDDNDSDVPSKQTTAEQENDDDDDSQPKEQQDTEVDDTLKEKKKSKKKKKDKKEKKRLIDDTENQEKPQKRKKT